LEVGSWKWWLSLAILLVAPPVFAWDEAIDSEMYRNPNLPMARKVIVFPEQMKSPWLEALRRPEADYLCPAALTIALAHRRGMKGLETAVTPLLEALDRADQHPSVRLAIAETLIELDSREAAGSLFRHAESGNQALRREIEPALARWDYKPAREVWVERLGQADASEDGVLLAIRALAELQEQRAIPALRDLVFSYRVSAPVRLGAAHALGLLRDAGLEADAKHLMTDGSRSGMVMRLAATYLLRRHQGEEALRLLQELGRDVEPAVAVVALGRLVEIDPKLVVPQISQLLANPDAKLRAAAVEVLFLRASAPNPADDHLDHINLLADRLNDPHPDIRVKARKALRDLARKLEHHKTVIQQAMRILTGSDWRGLEQAAILLGQLKHKPAAGRMVALLRFSRPEVSVSAAWGLRQLAVPETLPAALKYFQMAGEQATAPPVPSAPGGGKDGGKGGQLPPGIRQGPAPTGISPVGPVSQVPQALDQQLSQLAQFFGQSRYRPADAALRQRIPRAGAALMPIETRAAAIWALGLIHEGKPDTVLDQVLAARLSDLGGPFRPPEHPHVRWMAAVSLGRMKAQETLTTLRLFYGAKKPSLDPVNNACGWAIEQLTGEVMPPAGDEEVRPEPFKNWLQSFQLQP
jgi:HEAT repeat protein